LHWHALYRRVAAGAIAGLDEAAPQSYFAPILIHRLTGGALVRASAFRLETVHKRRYGCRFDDGVSPSQIGHPWS
jgi:hypothetical protein